MEFGAIFILVVVLIVVGAGAALLLGAGSALRRGKLNPEEDRIEGHGREERARRPEHRRASNEQRTRFIPNR
jgi:hypothetical protein